MDFLRKWLAQIQVMFTQLSVSEKLLMGTLAAVGLVMVPAVWHYSASPEMVAVLPQAIEADKRNEIVNFLTAQHITYRVEGDRVLVPAERRYEVQAALAAAGHLPEDTSAGFAQILASQNPWQSGDQQRQAYNIALQNELSRVIKAYPWVRNATVIISRPQASGFGATHQRPTAAVNIVMATGRLDQNKVDAIAGLVKGAVAEMTTQDVTVIDAVAGRQFKVKSDETAASSDVVESRQAQERELREKITQSLAYIRNVIVAVNVEIDPTRKVTESVKFDKEGTVDSQTETHTKTVETNEGGGGTEPGVRANAGADIAAAGGTAGRKSTTEENDSKFLPHVGETKEHASHPGGLPTRMNATVNIPRGFFVALYRQANPEPAAAAGAAPAAAAPKDPTDDQLKAIIDAQVAKIKKQVELLVATKETAGQVAVDVYPDAEYATTVEGGGTGGPAIAGTGTLLASGEYAKTIGLGTLALLSVGLMLMMVRKAGQRPPLPTAQELAGVPPVLTTTDDEMLGEVDTAESPLTGMEMADDEIRHRKLTDQVTELVKGNPSEAATLVKRWMRKAD